MPNTESLALIAAVEVASDQAHSFLTAQLLLVVFVICMLVFMALVIFLIPGGLWPPD